MLRAEVATVVLRLVVISSVLSQTLLTCGCSPASLYALGLLPCKAYQQARVYAVCCCNPPGEHHRMLTLGTS